MVAAPESEFVDILERTASNTGTVWGANEQRMILTRFLAHLTETDPTIPAKFQDFVVLQAKDDDFEDAEEEDEDDYDDYDDEDDEDEDDDYVGDYDDFDDDDDDDDDYDDDDDDFDD